MSAPATLMAVVPGLVTTGTWWQRNRTLMTLLCRLVLIVLTLSMLAGWRDWAYIVIVIAVPIVVLESVFRPGDRRGLSRVQGAALVAATVVLAFCFAAAIRGEWVFTADTATIAGGLGICLTISLSDAIASRRRSRDRDAMFEVIQQSQRNNAGSTFDPHWAFKSADDLTVWALDPARRTARVMAPSAPDTDTFVSFDQPIRAVELRRAFRRKGWFTPDTLASVRGDRVLEIVSGRTTADTWRLALPFYGTDSELARAWHEVFERWKRDDDGRRQAS